LGLFAARQALPFLSWTPRVNGKSLRADIVAALTGAVIVLPQGVAFAIIAGLPPQYGLYTAIITPNRPPHTTRARAASPDTSPLRFCRIHACWMSVADPAATWRFFWNEVTTRTG